MRVHDNAGESGKGGRGVMEATHLACNTNFLAFSYSSRLFSSSKGFVIREKRFSRPKKVLWSHSGSLMSTGGGISTWPGLWSIFRAGRKGFVVAWVVKLTSHSHFLNQPLPLSTHFSQPRPLLTSHSHFLSVSGLDFLQFFQQATIETGGLYFTYAKEGVAQN